MAEDKKDANNIEVKKPKVVKSTEKKIKAIPKVDIGSVKGKPRYKKGVAYDFSEEQIKILTKQNLI